MTEPANILAYQTVGTRTLPWWRRAIRSGLHLGGQFVAAIILVMSIPALLGWVTGSPWTIVVASLTIVTLTVYAAGAMKENRRRRVKRVLRYVDQAVRLRLPLVPMLRAAAEGERGATAKRLREVAQELLDGATLSRAVEVGVPESHRRIAALLRSAETAGTLPAALAELTDARSDLGIEQISRRAGTTAYIVVLGVAYMMAMFFVTAFVLPKFSQILRDFGVAGGSASVAPGLSVVGGWVGSVGKWMFSIFGSNALVLIVVLVLVVLLLAMTMQSVRVCFGWSSQTPGILGRWIGWVGGRMPIVGVMIRDRDWADVCYVAADGIRAGRPMEMILNDAKMPHLNPATHRQIDRWSAGLFEGKPLGQAAGGAGVPAAVAQMLAATRDDKQACAAFEFLSQYFRQRRARLQTLLTNLAAPTLILIAAVPVLILCRRIFDTIAQLVVLTASWSYLW